MDASNRRTPWDLLWGWFSSVRFGVLLLFLVALASVAGTLIRQHGTPEEYLKEYSPAVYGWILKLGLTDAYHTAWFRLLEVLLAASVTVSSLDRLPGVFRTIRQGVQPLPPETLPTLSFRREWELEGEVEGVRARVRGALAPYAPLAEQILPDGGWRGAGERMAWARLGAYIVHLGILVLLVGGLAGGIWGVDAMMNITEGTSETTAVVASTGEKIPLPFQVACDRFTVEFYPGTQDPSRFASDLKIYQDGTLRAAKTIEVNHPLEWGGYMLYQASYGVAEGGKVRFELVDQKTGRRRPVEAALQDAIPVDGGSGRFVVADYVPDLKVPMEGGASRELGPTAFVERYEGKVLKDRLPVLRNFPDFRKERWGRYRLLLKGSTQKYVSGIEVGRDPGARLFWLGTLLMFTGLYVSFFLSHRRVWVVLEPKGGGGWRLAAAGTSQKNPLSFQQELNRLGAALGIDPGTASGRSES